jgi:glycine/serine hydroxymethyltransferase
MKLTILALQEKNRQKHFINLIPSENFTSQAVLDALGSVMQSTFCAFSHHDSKLTGHHRQVLGRISGRTILRRKRAH